MSYDFEMFAADDPRLVGAGGASRISLNLGQVRANEVFAIFCDPETTAAVTSSPPIVRLFLEEVGFGLSTTRQGMHQKGGALVSIEMRQTLIAQLKSALANRALKKALVKASKESKFDVGAFISSIVDGKGEETGATATCDASVSPLRRPQPKRPTYATATHATSPRPSTRETAVEDDAFDLGDDANKRVMPRRPSDIRRNSLQGRAHHR
ncbi:MAG: hypothetical protein AAFU41_15395 [Pseudomonadota bacterium]